MSVNSGIGVSEDLAESFASAVESKSIRFVVVSIEKESLVHDGSIGIVGSLEQDLEDLPGIVGDSSTPAFILVRLDDPDTAWLLVTYVPSNATVRDKMVYASARASLIKSLGSSHFIDTLFASSPGELTPAAYAAHKASLIAPKPMNTRERALVDIQAAEREAGKSYEGSRARINHVGSGVGLSWSTEVEYAVGSLGDAERGKLVVITIEPASECLVLTSSDEVSADQLGSALPSSHPCYAFFSWPRIASRRDIIFIYSCPSASPIKHRMIYSSGCSSVYQTANSLLASSPNASLATRKIETSDPKELDEKYLISELGFDVTDESNSGAIEKPAFARPKGPGRKRL